MSAEILAPNGAEIHPPVVIHIVVHPDGKMEMTGPLERKEMFLKILLGAMQSVLNHQPPAPPKISLWDKVFKKGRS